MESKFNQFKEEILKRAKQADACKPEYARAYKSETFAELIQVIKDNFNFAVSGKVIEPNIIEEYKDEFNTNDVWCNVERSSGFVLAYDNATVKAYDNATVEAYDNATVEAYGNATVKAYDNATVEAYGNATVEAYGNATVEAYDNATVKAYDNATVKAYGNAYVSSFYVVECKLSDNAIHRIRVSNTIRYASDTIKFEKS